MYFNPAWCTSHILPVILSTPTFYKTHSYRAHLSQFKDSTITMVDRLQTQQHRTVIIISCIQYILAMVDGTINMRMNSRYGTVLYKILLCCSEMGPALLDSTQDMPDSNFIHCYTGNISNFQMIERFFTTCPCIYI